MILEFDADLNMNKRIVLGLILYGLGSLLFPDLRTHIPKEPSVKEGSDHNSHFASITPE